MKRFFGFLALVFLISFNIANACSIKDGVGWEARVTEQDQEKNRSGFRYKVIICSTREIEAHQWFDEEKIEYARHWEVNETRKHVPIKSSPHIGAQSSLSQRSTELYLETDGSIGGYSWIDIHSLRVVIIDIKERRVAWRNFNWD